MKNYSLLRLVALSGLLSLFIQPRGALAQWPTFDISSIKEGITSNIELVKQSKVVTDTMATAGKINSAIGDAKASASKFAAENIQKAQEKMKKLQEEKERIEKRKEEYEKIKKDIEEKKAAVEDYKRQAEAMKAQAEGYVDDAKAMKEQAEGYVDEAKEMKDAASDMVSAAKDKVSSNLPQSSENNLNEEQTVSDVDAETVTSGRTAFGIDKEIAEAQEATLPPTSEEKNYGEETAEQMPVEGEVEAAAGEEATSEMPTEADIQALTEEQKQLQEEQAALDKERAELEVDAMFAKTPEEKAAIEEKLKAVDAKSNELKAKMETNQAKLDESKASQKSAPTGQDANKTAETAEPKGRRPFGKPDAVNERAAPEANKENKAETNNVKSDSAKGKEAEKKQDEQPFHRAKILDGETSTKMEIPEAHRAKILDTYEAPKDHRPKILDEYQNQSGQNKAGGFRKRALPKTSALEGKHYASRSFSETLVFADVTGSSVPDGTVNGVFIFANRLAQECEISVSDLEDEKVMDECIKKLVKAKSDADASIAQEAEAIYRTIMQETVNALAAESMARKNEAANYEEQVMEKMEEQIANTKNTRDDTSGLSLTNMETQFLLNRILTIYSAQLSLDALEAIGGFDKSYYQDLDEEEESGEEK